ncbi:helix-turn-helix domain-containing protein [Flammeovirga kamogawensis]|uniref:AraC family transcriptional regulator n=1 Tax=Flammeovirga kamogawensis TaxID=373891 RepID=A0ABX8GVT2_9BACT|nr:helix-turn-helix transcriptional regulator [Flammeovirga kamogawensis]MBB6459892.1 AraC-like DNA-binding protein [Flammeovirga kamogawensis]QWG07055.1 AraC family transcriptional regulator [Flammeovirga kamogawensis]TRX68876.1 AraC family transcriptional regulator [Flammeovirga kamogawensis]
MEITSHNVNHYPDLIERLWIIDNKEEDTDIITPPSQYVNIIIPLNHSTYTYNGEVKQTPQIEGLSLQSSCIHYPKGSRFIGVRLYPHGLHSFLDIQGQEIMNKSIDFYPTLDVSIFNKSSTDVERLNNIYDQLKKMFIQKNYNEANLVREYYQYFRKTESMISIDEYCKEHSTNYTSLNRLFSKIIGLSPKRFERLIKFRRSLCDLIDSEESLTNIATDSGYFDQAHFIREFKYFLNRTPSAYQNLIKTADKETNIINYNFRLF